MGVNLLSVSNLSKSFGDRVLFSDVGLGIDSGDKVGLIGANGAGKSLLLSTLVGRTEADAGTVTLRGDIRVGFLDQEPEFAHGASARETIEQGIAELKSAIGAYEAAAAANKPDVAELLARVEILGGWQYQHRVERAAASLGVQDLDAPVERLSGGERKRVALARLVVQQADLLILDEPTNHLDAETVGWLEQWLHSVDAGVLLVTHDRYFLDRVVTRLVELRDGAVRAYRGNYTDYVAARAVEEAQQGRTRHRQLRSLMTELEWARRSPKARTGKSQARLQRIEEAQKEVARLSQMAWEPSMSFGSAPRLGHTILEINDMAMAYNDGVPLIRHLDFNVRRGECIGIVGRNGSGKSTLLKLVQGALKPTGGRILRGKNTQIAFFDQERAFLDASLGVREALVEDGGDTVFPGGEAVHVNSWLARFGFSPEHHRRPVSSLSGGERNRLAMAKFLLQEANVLLLDEPTNDLDIPTLNVLEEALAGFAGCVFVVSHDRYFLDKVATAIVAFEGHLGEPGQVTLVQGNYTMYRTLRGDQLEAERDAGSRGVGGDPESASDRGRANRRRNNRTKKPLTYGEEKELASLEPRIADAEAKVAQLQADLENPDVWSAGHERGAALNSKLVAAKADLDALFERWEELMTRLEQGEQER